MSKSARVQVRINPEIKDIGEKLASEWGLNSYQDLIRFWTLQAAKGNLNVSISNEIELTSEQEKALIRMERDFEKAEKAGEIYVAHSAKELIDQLMADE